MPAYKDKNGTWYLMIRYTDWRGEKKQKCQRGFETKRDALAWEAQFKLKKRADIDMALESFYSLYKAVVEDLEDRQRELAVQNKTLEERNQKIKFRIMTEEEVKALPKPQKTLGGDYKVSPKKYQNLLATAKRVDFAEYNQRMLRDKEAELEKKRRLPIPERMELSALRKMKAIVEKVAMLLPEGWLRDVLVAAIDGRDLIAEQQRQQMRNRRIQR